MLEDAKYLGCPKFEAPARKHNLRLMGQQTTTILTAIRRCPVTVPIAKIARQSF